MPFDSVPFLLVFFPAALLVLTLLRRTRRPQGAKLWLIGASLVFYGMADAPHVWLFISSACINYFLGLRLLTPPARANPRLRGTLLALGIFWNLGVLCAVKYRSFLAAAAGPLWGLAPSARSEMPLGISFYTFTQLMFLVDSHAGLLEAPYRFGDYFLFATFFPYATAGPLVKHEEVIPQIERGTQAPPLSKAVFGLTLFILGLFKKMVFADRIGAFADSAFAAADQGLPMPALGSWIGATAFALQLYFDFSGYSDMAVGLGEMLGVRLPYNFNSPYKASDMIEFWQRWHMTLTRFLTNYIYNPIVLNLTRRRLQRGESLVVPGQETVSAFLILVAVPTLLTMLAAGIWHGAGWTFICFGLLHGTCIVANHANRILRRRMPGRAISLPNAANRLLTFTAVVVSFVFFRSRDMLSARRMLSAMAGFDRGPAAALAPAGLALTAIGGLLVIAWFLPNSQQLCSMALTETSPGERRPNPSPALTSREPLQ